MENILKKLDKFECLSQQESYQLFKLIISGNVSQKILLSILTSMCQRGETIEEITGAIYAFLEAMKHFPRPDYIFSDIVGTGGDTNNTINISTASAFVAATCGLKIVKHCNQGISSKSGSSDLLKKFHINLHASAEKSRQSLDQLNICFLFAPKYHAGFKYCMNVRKILKKKTIFNLLGPFLNPSIPPLIVIGVYHKKFVYPFAKILSRLNYQRGIVLHGNNTDEVTLNGITYITEFYNGKLISYELQPSDFGLQPHSLQEYIESTPVENHTIISNILKGKGKKIDEELIAVNVAILLKIFGNENLKKNTIHALNIIRSGKAYHRINNLSHILKED